MSAPPGAHRARRLILLLSPASRPDDWHPTACANMMEGARLAACRFFFVTFKRKRRPSDRVNSLCSPQGEFFFSTQCLRWQLRQSNRDCGTHKINTCRHCCLLWADLHRRPHSRAEQKLQPGGFYFSRCYLTHHYHLEPQTGLLLSVNLRHNILTERGKNPTNSFNCSFFHCPLPGGTEGCDTHDTYNASCESNVFCEQIAKRFLKGFRFQFAFACLWFFLGSSQRAWCLTLDLIHAQTSEEVSLYSAGMYPLCYAILCYAMLCQHHGEPPIFSVVRTIYKWTGCWWNASTLRTTVTEVTECLEYKSLEPSLLRTHRGKVCGKCRVMYVFASWDHKLQKTVTH